MPSSSLPLPQQFPSPGDNLPRDKVAEEELFREKRCWGRVERLFYLPENLNRLSAALLLSSSFLPLSTTEDDIISLQSATVAIFPAQLLLGIS